MAHEKSYLICESKCFIEGVSKDEYDTDMAAVNDALGDKLSKTETAVRAKADSTGRVIDTTYATKAEFTDYQAVVDSKLESVVGSDSGTAYAAVRDQYGNVIDQTYVTKGEYYAYKTMGLSEWWNNTKGEGNVFKVVFKGMPVSSGAIVVCPAVVDICVQYDSVPALFLARLWQSAGPYFLEWYATVEKGVIKNITYLTVKNGEVIQEVDIPIASCTDQVLDLAIDSIYHIQWAQ